MIGEISSNKELLHSGLSWKQCKVSSIQSVMLVSCYIGIHVLRSLYWRGKQGHFDLRYYLPPHLYCGIFPTLQTRWQWSTGKLYTNSSVVSLCGNREKSHCWKDTHLKWDPGRPVWFQRITGTMTAILRHIHATEAHKCTAMMDSKGAYDLVARQEMSSMPLQITTRNDINKVQCKVSKGVTQGSPSSFTFFNIYMDTLRYWLEANTKDSHGKAASKWLNIIVQFANNVEP